MAPTTKSGGDGDTQPPKKSSGPLLLILLLGGGAVVALLACGGCGVGGYILFFTGKTGGAGAGLGAGGAPTTMVGTWTMQSGLDTWTWDFKGNGTAKVVAKGPTVQTDVKGAELTTTFNYKFTPGNPTNNTIPAMLEITDTKTEGGVGSSLLQAQPGQAKRYEVRFTATDAQLTNKDGPGFMNLARK